MNDPQDQTWLNLVTLSAPAYAGNDAPPYGFATRFLARLRAEERQQELMERIGLRAVFAAFGILVLAVGINIGWSSFQTSDLEPGMGRLVQTADVPFS